MLNFKVEIAQTIAKAINLDEQELESYIETPKDSKNGDYAFPCFRLAKELKKAPPMIANEIKEKIQMDETIIEKVEIVGGYLNFYINKTLMAKEVLEEVGSSNEYGKSKGVRVEHYLVSSGTKEIIDGTSIAKEFKKIYGCEFYYDPETKLPVWPKFAINYTQKTQYFFRISKGITNKTDDSVNNKTVSRRIPYENMVYLGDGMTDVPCMVLVKQNNGNAIAIYNKKEQGNVSSLLRGGRVNFACLADYSENSDLDKTMKLIIDKISINHTLKCKEEELLKKEMRREKSAK